MARIAVIGCILEISVISLTVVGEVDDINTLTGKLGNISGVTVKTAIAKKEI